MAAEQARFFRSTPDGHVHCELCPRHCDLAEGQTGACLVRRNQGGALALPWYGAVSALAIDPVEKKPLYHFMPGTGTFSVGYVGCNLHCPFCQNYHISRRLDAPVQRLSPVALVERALASGCPSMAHTYSEPLVHAEYVACVMRLARQSGLKNILVTNGCVEAAAASELLADCDAVNVDLKSWDAGWYQAELGGNKAAVLDFIRLAVAKAVHTEVTSLVIPGKTDGEADIADMAAWLAGVSPDIVYHLSAYRPMYQYRVPPPDRKTLERLVAKARLSLSRVYAGNQALCR